MVQKKQSTLANPDDGVPARGVKDAERVMFSANGDFDGQLERWLSVNPEYEYSDRDDHSSDRKPYREAIFVKKGGKQVTFRSKG